MIKAYSTAQLVRRMAGLVRHLRFQYVFAVAGAVLGFLTTLLIPALIIDLAWSSLRGYQPQWLSLLLLIVLGVLRGLFRYMEHYFGHYVAFKTLFDFRCMVFAKLRRLAPAKLDRQDSGNLLKMIGEDIEAMEVFFAHTVPPTVTALVVTLILFVYYCRVSLEISFVALGTYAVLAIVLPKLFAHRLQPLLASQSESRRAYMSLFLDSLRGMKDLIQLRQVAPRFQDLEARSLSVNRREAEVAKANYVQTSVIFLTIGLAIMLVAALAFKSVQSGQMTLKTSTTLIVVFATSFAPYLELSRLPLGFKRAVNAAREVFTLLDEEELDKTGRELTGPLQTIRIKNLHFSYDNSEQMIYQQLSCSFEKGKIIGLVGASGSGKSTLMKLIMGWYQVTEGRIVLNDHSLSQLDARTVQAQIAYIPQMPQVFNQTIRENVTLGKPNVTDELILEAARKCRIEDKILATEKGLDTMLNREQNIFSAGELQRLELTRALLKEADCYIFDEPTSNLDSLNEAAFLQVIKEHCKGYVFLISHRNSTVACSDVIYRVANQQLETLKV